MIDVILEEKNIIEPYHANIPLNSTWLKKFSNPSTLKTLLDRFNSIQEKEKNHEWISSLTKDAIQEKERKTNAGKKKRPIKIDDLKEESPPPKKVKMDPEIAEYLKVVRKNVNNGNLGLLPDWAADFLKKDEKMPPKTQLEKTHISVKAVIHFWDWQQKRKKI